MLAKTWRATEICEGRQLRGSLSHACFTLFHPVFIPQHCRLAGETIPSSGSPYLWGHSSLLCDGKGASGAKQRVMLRLLFALHRRVLLPHGSASEEAAFTATIFFP